MAEDATNNAAVRLAIVVPCYNEEEVLPETCRRLAAKLASLVECGIVASQSRVLFVNDGSRDATWSLIKQASLDPAAFGIAPDAPWFEGICFAHNEGHQNALFAGLMRALEAGFTCTISLDADLQDDIDAMDEMLEKHHAGAEIVYGVRSNRDTDTVFKRGTAEAFYGFMRWLGVEMVSDSADYRLMGRRAVEALSRYGEVNLFLRGIVPALGFSTDKVYYVRGARFAGESRVPAQEDALVRVRRYHVVFREAHPLGIALGRAFYRGRHRHARLYVCEHGVRPCRRGLVEPYGVHLARGRSHHAVARYRRRIYRKDLSRGEGASALHHR